MKAFNLIEEPWIPVRTERGVVEVGLREALLEAHRFERLEASSPLVEAALTRVLLAVLHRAYRGPKSESEQENIFEEGSFEPVIVGEYLDRWKDRFWLFHPTTPFWQVPDLPEDDPLPWTKLRPEFAVGNNPTLFDHTYDDAPPAATFAEAARALVAHQTFTTGGLIRRYGVQSGVGAPLAVSAAFIALGDSLFQTLAQALVVYDEADDVPVWEAGPVSLEELKGDKNKQPSKKVPFFGLTRVYTWLSRGVRLLIEDEEKVRYMAYGPGVHPVVIEPFSDPMAAYKKNARTKELVPVRLRTDKRFWRDFAALFPEEGAGVSPRALDSARHVRREAGLNRALRIKVVGQVTDQAKVLEIRRELYPLPVRAQSAALRHYVARATGLADAAASCLRSAGWKLASELISISRQPDKDEVRSLMESFPLLPHFWNLLGNSFGVYLEMLDSDPDKAWEHWSGRVNAAAAEAWLLTTREVGTEARQLKAIQEAERNWRYCMAKEGVSERKN
ncbi:type I-E CRISPR-associated protein Cse1/CasA [Oceanithermus sp.]